MKFRMFTMTSLIGSTALAVGCFGGGGGSGGGSAAAGASVGVITSGLPASTREASYDFTPFSSPATPVSGAYYTQMEGVGGDLLASDSPFSNIDRVDAQGNSANEASFLNDAKQLITINGIVYAALSSTEAPGAGDIYQRSGSVWTLTRNGSENEITLAQGAGGGMWAAEGTRGTGNSANVLWNDGVSGFTSVATIESSIPTAAIEFNGELWLGSADSGTDGGPMHLHHGTTSALTPWTEEIDLPVQAIGMGVRQQVTDMFVYTMVVDSSTTPPLTRDLLFIAVGNFSVGTGQSLSGQVMVTDGSSLYEVVANFVGATPNCIAWHDDTLYIGDSAGRLWWRNHQTGGITAETGLDMNTVNDLFVDAAGDLLIAGGDDNGPVLTHRAAVAGPVTNLYYVDDVAPLLAQNCATCHNGTDATASAVFQIASPRDDAADYPVVQTKIDTVVPDMSVLLLEASNDSAVGGHAGGELWASGSASYNTVLTWIQQGGEYEAPTTPPPPPAGPTTFVDIYTFLRLDCQSCHAGGTGGFTMNTTASTSYTSAVSKTNSGTPESSLIITKPRGAGNHVIIAGYANGQTKSDLLIKWIADGTLQQ